MPILWTQRVTPADLQWKGLAWSPSLRLLVAVGDHGGGALQQVMTSPDAVNWTAQTIPATCNNDFLDVAWSPALGLFCAVGDPWGGGFEFMTSPDGINWTGRSAPSVRVWSGIQWVASLGLFVAVGTGQVGAVATSPDGIVWTPQDMPVSRQWVKLAWSATGGGILIAVAFDGAQPQYARSVDAAAAVWAGIAAPGGSNWTEVIDANGRFLVTSGTGFVNNAQSVGGLVFTFAAGTIPVGSSPRCMAYYPEANLLVMGASVTPFMYSSTDLMGTWVQETLPVIGGWYDVIWVAELNFFVACAASGAAGTRIVTGEVTGLKRKGRRHRGGELWGIIPEVAPYLG